MASGRRGIHRTRSLNSIPRCGRALGLSTTRATVPARRGDPYGEGWTRHPSADTLGAMRSLPRTLAWVAAARAFSVDLAAERNPAHWVSGVVQLSAASPRFKGVGVRKRW